MCVGALEGRVGAMQLFPFALYNNNMTLLEVFNGSDNYRNWLRKKLNHFFNIFLYDIIIYNYT